MSDYFDEGERGASIIPSARKPIHNNTRYLNKMSYQTHQNKQKQHFPIPEDEGTDEVDNIMSKPVRPLSPISNRKLPSGSDVEEESSDSDNEELLSSSPPRSSSSISINNSNYESFNCRRSYSDIHNLSNQYTKEGSRRNSVARQQYDLKTDKSNYTLHLFVALIVVAAAFSIMVFYNANPQQAITSSTYDRFSFNNDIQSIGLQYKIKDDSLLQVQTGINTIFEKQDTGSFIFTYDSSLQDFDSNRFNKFMDNIAWAASKFLRNNTQHVQHVVLDNSKIISLKSDYELIEKFRNNVDNRGVLLVKNIEQIPSKLAMAFHYYCDEYNPLVRKSAIFFTLNVAECSSSPNQRATHAFIEKCLKVKWKDVQLDKIGPLLNRVVNIVVDVMSV